MNRAIEGVVEIVLVEDNPDDVELALKALRRSGIANEIRVLRDGVEAVEYLFCTGAYAHRDIADAPSMILLDLKLPRIDGLEVLRRIKADARTRSLPIIVLTSSREERDIVDSYQLGVNSYIVKPVDFEQFTEAIRQLSMYWLVLNQLPMRSRPAA